MVASRIIAKNEYKSMNNNPLHEDARCFYATSGFTKWYLNEKRHGKKNIYIKASGLMPIVFILLEI